MPTPHFTALPTRQIKQLQGILTACLLTPPAAASAPSMAVPPTPTYALPRCPSTTPNVPHLTANPTLPPLLDGQVSFYAARYDAKGNITSDVTLGDPDQLAPIASIYKTQVLWQLARQIDTGKITTSQRLTTTEAQRSIENYPAGVNSVQTLAERMIKLSDNTAADMLMRLVGPGEITRTVWQKSPCTSILLTTKAMWAAQSGLISGYPAGAAAYASSDAQNRLRTAELLNAQALALSGPAIEQALDVMFHAPDYDPQLDDQLQPTSTARALTNLHASTLGGQGLKNRAFFRQTMTQGCCTTRQPLLNTTYRANKAGSGWRILTLSGYAELKSGGHIAYAFLSNRNTTPDAEDLEKALRPLTDWVERELTRLK